MKNQSSIKGNSNIVIQNVTDSTIVLNVGGVVREIPKTPEALAEVFQNQPNKQFQTADKIYNIEAINEANFYFVVEQSKHNQQLPNDLAENIISDRNRWIESLHRTLLRYGVSVSKSPLSIFQHYGWLIETFLFKTINNVGRVRNLRRLSFMAEAFQSSLRYLCYIQLSQILKQIRKSPNASVQAFFQLNEQELEEFDFLNFLVITTNLLPKSDSFMPELHRLVAELTNTESDLYGTALFLEKQRNDLIQNKILEDEKLDALLDQYLTALVFWLRKIAFLAKYRLVSIKDVQLSYRLGTAKNFVHHYGELNGAYHEVNLQTYDILKASIQDHFTYNQSVLLFKGSNINYCLQKIQDSNIYLSLSPLLIDQSVFSNKKNLQTPEIYYYIGKQKRKYHFAYYQNELEFGTHIHLAFNKKIKVQFENSDYPKLNELYEQLEQVFDYQTIQL